MLLDLIKKITININTETEEVIIFSDNKYVTKMINESDLILSDTIQDVSSIIISIRDELKNSLLHCKIEYTKGYPKKIETFKTNPGAFLMKWYNKEARITRINNRMSASNNITNYNELILSYQEAL